MYGRPSLSSSELLRVQALDVTHLFDHLLRATCRTPCLTTPSPQPHPTPPFAGSDSHDDCEKPDTPTDTEEHCPKGYEPVGHECKRECPGAGSTQKCAWGESQPAGAAQLERAQRPDWRAEGRATAYYELHLILTSCTSCVLNLHAAEQWTAQALAGLANMQAP